MAAHIFCPQCGTKNDFANGRRPNFCTSCGYNFASLAAFGGNTTPQAATPPARSEARQSDNSDVMDISIGEPTSSGRGGNDDGFRKEDALIEGVVPLNQQKMKLGSIINTASQGFDGARQSLNVKGKKVNAKAALNNYKSEAKGSSEMKEIGATKE